MDPATRVETDKEFKWMIGLYTDVEVAEMKIGSREYTVFEVAVVDEVIEIADGDEPHNSAGA